MCFILDLLAGLGSKPGSLSAQLVDVVVACESFFTLGQSTSRQEIAYRVSTAAAQMAPLLMKGLNKALVFHLVNCAYNIRSRVVYGDEVRPKDLTFKGAPPALGQLSRENQLNYFIFTIAELIRRGLLHALDKGNPGDEVRLDWDAILFGES